MISVKQKTIELSHKIELYWGIFYSIRDFNLQNTFL